MAKSLTFRNNIIRRPGDKEVVGKMMKWGAGINPLARAIEKALDDQSSTGLRDSTKPEKGRRVVR